MKTNALSELLSLPASDRAELAMALWESLSESERQAELQLTEEQAAELDRRWEEHLRNPSSGISWPELRAKLSSRR